MGMLFPLFFLLTFLYFFLLFFWWIDIPASGSCVVSSKRRKKAFVRPSKPWYCPFSFLDTVGFEWPRVGLFLAAHLLVGILYHFGGYHTHYAAYFHLLKSLLDYSLLFLIWFDTGLHLLLDYSLLQQVLRLSYMLFLELNQLVCLVLLLSFWPTFLPFLVCFFSSFFLLFSLCQYHYLSRSFTVHFFDFYCCFRSGYWTNHGLGSWDHCIF